MALREVFDAHRKPADIRMFGQFPAEFRSQLLHREQLARVAPLAGTTAQMVPGDLFNQGNNVFDPDERLEPQADHGLSPVTERTRQQVVALVG